MQPTQPLPIVRCAVTELRETLFAHLSDTVSKIQVLAKQIQEIQEQLDEVERQLAEKSGGGHRLNKEILAAQEAQEEFSSAQPIPIYVSDDDEGTP